MSRLDANLGRLQRCDEWLCVRINGASRHAVVLRLFRAVSWLGDGIIWYALMLALLVQRGAEAAYPVLHMALVGLACTATYRVLKQSTSRPRPYQAVPAIVVGATPLDAYSFPSGHTLHAVAFTMVAASHYPALAGLLSGFTALVAVSRVILGLHYPSDVAAGALVGGAIAGASFWI
jgi:undecaprenyl-diphosphatase